MRPNVTVPKLNAYTSQVRACMRVCVCLGVCTSRPAGRRAGHAGATLHVYSDKCWTVSDLCVTECGDLGLLAGLPRCSTGKVRLTGNEYSSVATAQVSSETHAIAHTAHASDCMHAHSGLYICFAPSDSCCCSVC